ncbi:MAG: RsmB/NOP family class I SAM-dependent RNA methyltransferase [Methanotrichaceae archaeon]
MDSLDRYRNIVPDFEHFKAILNVPMPVSARINTLKIGRQILLEHFERKGIGYRSLSWYPLGIRLDVKSPGKLAEHTLGYIHIQEEVSMIPPLVLQPQPGETILDLCSAPGSKTTQISQQMDNRGIVIANEPSLARITPLRSNCERLGAINVAITRYDGRRFPNQLFDRILVDVPCSGEGRARKDLGICGRSSLKRSLGFQALQKGLLKRAINLVKPGGVVVYSTCTYAPEENEIVVESVLDEAHLDKISIHGLVDSPGITKWNGVEHSNDLLLCARYYPHYNDTGGFFVAKLIKN